MLVPGDIAANSTVGGISTGVSDVGELASTTPPQRTYEKIEDITAEKWDGMFPRQRPRPAGARRPWELELAGSG